MVIPKLARPKLETDRQMLQNLRSVAGIARARVRRALASDY